MVVKEHLITFEGLDAKALPLATLREMSSWLTEVLDRAMRLRIEGRSSARGSTPSWLTASRDVRLVELRSGSAQLVLSALSLRDTNPDLFVQGDLFQDAPAPEETPVDVLVDSLRDAVSGNRDSNRLDQPLLESLLRARALFDLGVTGVVIVENEPVEIRSKDFERIEALASSALAPRVERAVGVLDSLRMSTGAFWLERSDRTRLRGILPSAALNAARSHLGECVEVEGTISFKPSGQPLRIEAYAIRGAEAADAIWSRGPRRSGASRATAGGSWLDLPWPGDESEETVENGLQEPL